MRTSSLFSSLALVAAVSACSSSPSAGCKTSADCGAGQVCLSSGFCTNVGGSSTTAATSSGSSTTSASGATTTTASASSSGATTTATTTTAATTTASSSTTTAASGTTTATTSSSTTSSGGSCGTCNAGFTCDAAAGLCKDTNGVPQLSSVWIIVMENTSYASLTSSNAPYLFGTVIPEGVLMTNYSAVTHPSLPNYIAMVGGDRFNVTSDGPASSSTYQVPANTPNIATQLEAVGLTWHEYSETQPTPCAVDDSGLFVSKHDPMPHFLITQNNPTSCNANDVSFDPQSGMPGLAADLAANTFFNYNFISPNLCEDGHNSCAPISNKETQQDTFLSNNLQTILNSSAYQNNGVVFITWDENDQTSGGNVYSQVLTVILSPMLSTTSKGGTNGTAYSHFSMLATIEAGFGLANLPAANGHTDALITDIWK